MRVKERRKERKIFSKKYKLERYLLKKNECVILVVSRSLFLSEFRHSFFEKFHQIRRKFQYRATTCSILIYVSCTCTKEAKEHLLPVERRRKNTPLWRIFIEFYCRQFCVKSNILFNVSHLGWNVYLVLAKIVNDEFHFFPPVR